MKHFVLEAAKLSECSNILNCHPITSVSNRVRILGYMIRILRIVHIRIRKSLFPQKSAGGFTKMLGKDLAILSTGHENKCTLGEVREVSTENKLPRNFN
ncbi:hypothetical protein AVEN_208158-1 [Araneus ventricosus]|uniref:Uncharacterized protein n=1 Tax=Araneus ventricosus TaxID=182803 RepID=A0A4Y2EQH3_ARAVE|nr:hypothetical protein AVEN_15921-1 [Araneus ventricosus]GBM31148.1 hypothetical protein AVEN_208158-1 [Araneus ventricosus]